VGVVSTPIELDWPQVSLGPVQRMRVLAASIPGAVLRERLMEVPFDAVWGVAADLESSLARYEPLVSRARIAWRHGDRLTLETWSPGGMPTRFDVELQPGWCVMQEARRLYVVGMAAQPEGEGTRFAHMEGVPRRGGGLLAPVVRRAVDNDLANIERLAREAAG
jgi:hypothetical protein